MMDRDIALLLVGAGIALVSAIVTAILAHWLALRADKARRERDAEEKQSEYIRQQLLAGLDVTQARAASSAKLVTASGAIGWSGSGEEEEEEDEE